MFFYKWFRKLNQNFKTILITIFIVIFFIILLQTIFAIIRNNRDSLLEGQIDLQNAQITNETIENDNETQNTEISNNNFSKNINIDSKSEETLEKFLTYCNNSQINEAYEMISNNCKKNVFPTIEDFTNNYIKVIFTEKKTAKLEKSMYGNQIYKISYYADLLSNGGYQQSNLIEDYIYFSEENNETKINVNRFLYTQEINKNAEVNSIYINIIKKDVYIDYEVYQIQVTNRATKPILLNSGEEKESVVIQDENKINYPSNINDQSIEKLLLQPNQTKILTIQFSKIYNEERSDISFIQFSDIVVNYEQYIQGEAKKTETIDIAF